MFPIEALINLIPEMEKSPFAIPETTAVLPSRPPAPAITLDTVNDLAKKQKDENKELMDLMRERIKSSLTAPPPVAPTPPEFQSTPIQPQTTQGMYDKLWGIERGAGVGQNLLNVLKSFATSYNPGLSRVRGQVLNNEFGLPGQQQIEQDRFNNASALESYRSQLGETNKAEDPLRLLQIMSEMNKMDQPQDGMSAYQQAMIDARNRELNMSEQRMQPDPLDNKLKQLEIQMLEAKLGNMISTGQIDQSIALRIVEAAGRNALRPGDVERISNEMLSQFQSMQGQPVSTPQPGSRIIGVKPIK